MYSEYFSLAIVVTRNILIKAIDRTENNISWLIINQLIEALTAGQMKLFCIFSNENRQN